MKAHEREKLKDQVMDMILTGYTQRKIAVELGITERTVVNYSNSRRAEALKDMRATAEEQMAEMELNKKKRIQRLWTTILGTDTSTKDKNMAIRLLQNEEVLDIKRRQMIGMLPQEPPVVAIQNTNVVEGTTTIADSIRRNYPELIDKFSMNKVRLINDRQEDTQGDKARLTGPTQED